MKNYVIQEPVVKAILAYLKERPYKDVSEGIKALESLREVTIQGAPESIGPTCPNVESTQP